MLAGEDNFHTRVRENDCVFAFNYAKVYWYVYFVICRHMVFRIAFCFANHGRYLICRNSRLGMEHRRLLDTFSNNDVICDLMAGVGPFVVPVCEEYTYVLGRYCTRASIFFVYLPRPVSMACLFMVMILIPIPIQPCVKILN